MPWGQLLFFSAIRDQRNLAWFGSRVEKTRFGKARRTGSFSDRGLREERDGFRQRGLGIIYGRTPWGHGASTTMAFTSFCLVVDGFRRLLASAVLTPDRGAVNEMQTLIFPGILSASSGECPVGRSEVWL